MKGQLEEGGQYLSVIGMDGLFLTHLLTGKEIEHILKGGAHVHVISVCVSRITKDSGNVEISEKLIINFS